MKLHPHAASNPHAAWVVASLVMLSCNRVPEPDSGAEEESSEATAAASSTPSSTKVDSRGAQSVGAESPGSKVGNVAPAEGGDPERGEFTLDEALAGLAGTGAPSAKLETDLGTLECKLYQDKAPIAVANFIGLARGTRPWKDPKGQWVKVPAYDGTVFHRIIKGFMIQGGDPEGTGKGGPGYVFKDEVWAGAKHDRRGLLCMANRGPNTNGAQFFILDGAAPHLDRGYTIFGECGPEAVIEKLASVPVLGERPTKAPVIKRVTITRQ